jgi:hypothetical protein
MTDPSTNATNSSEIFAKTTFVKSRPHLHIHRRRRRVPEFRYHEMDYRISIMESGPGVLQKPLAIPAVFLHRDQWLVLVFAKRDRKPKSGIGGAGGHQRPSTG